MSSSFLGKKYVYFRVWIGIVEELKFYSMYVYEVRDRN